MVQRKVTSMIILMVLNLIILSVIHGQSLKFRAGGSLDLHLKQKETTGQNTPFESEKEYPSIAAFFDDNNGYNLDLSFRFGNESTKKGQIFIGFKSEFATLKSNSSDGKIILGENLSQQKYSPYVGMGNYIDTGRCSTFLYGFIGYTSKSYKGEGRISGQVNGQTADFNVDYGYVNTGAFMLGGGIDLENLGNTPVTLGISVYADIGKIERGKSDIFYNGTKIGELTPTGENSLYDNTIYLSLSIAYQINF